MLANLEYLSRKFDYFNQLCFAGQLTPPPLRISKGRRILGLVRFKRHCLPDGKCHYSDFVLAITGVVELAEQQLEDIIMHEMIHYFILSNQLRDTSPHGVLFKQKMYDFNKRYNRHITIRYKMPSPNS